MDLLAAIDAMERAIDETIPFAAMDAGMLIATQAQTGHTYTNRTGRLEASTRADSVRGSWRSGYTLTVAGATPYGSFLEEGTATIQGYAFLMPAYERVETQVDEILANAMAYAVDAVN